MGILISTKTFWRNNINTVLFKIWTLNIFFIITPEDIRWRRFSLYFLFKLVLSICFIVTFLYKILILPHWRMRFSKISNIYGLRKVIDKSDYWQEFDMQITLHKSFVTINSTYCITFFFFKLNISLICFDFHKQTSKVIMK